MPLTRTERLTFEIEAAHVTTAEQIRSSWALLARVAELLSRIQRTILH